MLNVAVLVSGGGTNLQAILDSVEKGIITNTKISLVISNKPDAYALERATKKDIPTAVLVPKEYESREAFGEALI
ncbi:MAG: phosphoribosylglycinamide formyltransferase, partial [Eubacterium sp.]|nr:phosphoribosylglycinamide formyltransferase [Eubacterium sp.]